MATVKEIAKKCGVSIGTVDRVLHNRGRVSPETRQRVLEAVDELQYVPNRAAQSLAVRKKKLHLGFVQVDGELFSFFADVNAAARKKAADLSEYGVRVSFFQLNIPARLDREMKASLSVPDDVDIAKLDGITLPGTIPYKEVGNLVPAGIPKVYYNLEASGEEPLAYVGCDYGRAGKIAAGLCVLCSGDKGNIAVFTFGDVSAQVSSYTQRVAAFNRCLETEYPDFAVAGELFFGNNHEENIRLCREFFRQHPDLTAIYLVNPGDYSICNVIRKLDPERKIHIITNDLLDVTRQMLRDGIISAVIDQEPSAQGSCPLDILYEYLAFGKKPQTDKIYTKLDVRLAANMDF